MKRADTSTFWPSDALETLRGSLAKEAAWTLLNDAFESSGEALLLVEASGFIARANARARDLLRLPDGQMGTPVNMREFLSSMPADALSQLQALYPEQKGSFKASLPNGYPVRVTLRSLVAPLNLALLCIEEGSVVQRAEAKWHQTEAELFSLLESIPTGVILFDPSGRLRSYNIRFGQFFGLDARVLEEIATFTQLEELISGRFRNAEVFAGPWRSFRAGHGAPGHDELEVLRPDRRVLERFFRPVLDPQGLAVGWLELYADVTGERQTQSKILQTEKTAALGLLVSGIAHELNNPLTAIMGYAQLLLRHGLLPEQLAQASMVYEEAERARRIVKNLLYFARENSPERAAVDVNEVIARTVALRSYELKMENIVTQCALAEGLPRTMADAYQLQQVVLNLIVNAEHALLESPGHGYIRIRTALSTKGGRDWIVVEVSDDGPGISQEISSKVFDPFFTTKPAGTGTGLGLSIVYGIIHQHHGEISFESHPGQGTKFLIELPVVAAPEQKETCKALTERHTPAITGRILVVEDEPTVGKLIVDVLREEGHEIEAVLDSHEGLTRLSGADYDLIICDLRMPLVDGYAFYEALVRSGSPMQRHIIFITGDVLAPRTLEFLVSRGLPYLAKPFLVEELKLAVKQALNGGDEENHDAGPELGPKGLGGAGMAEQIG